MIHSEDSLSAAGKAETVTSRRAHMAVLARAGAGELDALLGMAGPLPGFTLLKAPETGTVMVEGRAGGAGSRFNLGEASVTRCVIRLDSGTMGFSYALGRDREKARLAALVEALLQEEPEAGPLHAGLGALAERQSAAKLLASRKAAATKVEFFTMVRGAG